MKKILTILLLITTNAFGAKYYVKPTGNDANSGLSELLAWQHVVKACTTLVAGDTVLIRSGTYNETSYKDTTHNEGVTTQIGFTPVNSGTPGNYIVFKGYPGDVRPLILGMSNASANASNARSTACMAFRSYIIFDSLEFRHGYQGIRIHALSHDLIIRNCIVDSTLSTATETNNGGVLTYEGGDASRCPYRITIENCVFFANGCFSLSGGGTNIYTDAHNTSGIHNYSCDSCIFRYNTIHDENNGIALKRQARWTEIYGNTIYNITLGGLRTMWGGCAVCSGLPRADARFHHNVLWNCGQGLKFQDGSPGHVGDSLLYFYNNTIDCGGTGGGIDGWGNNYPLISGHFFNNIIYNPALVNEGFDNTRAGFSLNATGGNAVNLYEDYNLFYGRGANGQYYIYPQWTLWTLPEWVAGSPPGALPGHGSHNIIADPLFTDRANRNYILQAGSPALTGGRGGSFTFYPDSRPTTVILPTYMGAFGDSAPTITGLLSIGNVTVTEGGSAVFSVTLSAAQASNLTFSSITSSGTATGGTPVPGCVAGVDFLNSSSTRTITAGQTSTTITVPTCDDAAVEAQEQFYVTISNPSISTVVISNNTGTGTINDNDLAPSPGNKRIELKGKVRLAGKVRVGSKP